VGAWRGTPYFLVLGTIEGRKNHGLLLGVWRRLVERLGEAAPKLVIVGTRGWEAEEVTRQLDALGPLQAHVEELSRCSDEQLSGLMAGARALLMPSFTEGYGLPVFEALELGCPVIAADLPVYHEVAGSIPDYLSPENEDAWVAVIIDYLRDEPRRAAQLTRMSGFKVPDWSAHFAAVEQWLERQVA
jgi:glycosyltransferase involved in cell wall biosynthesis